MKSVKNWLGLGEILYSQKQHNYWEGQTAGKLRFSLSRRYYKGDQGQT